MEPDYVKRDELRAELAELRLELIKWMVATAIAMAGVAVTMTAIIGTFLRSGGGS